ncbi:ankyrin repeat domain-containing protein [Candidatus Wolbachia massiliensis]|uniref:Ankyrin repeat domain-containing protein n=1 Tax=Candidatus Wolbachia massiliensis TaxID=1845000 RepID=A0A7M3U389_9RICK|nr:ankyrin repeat domain-containing protein [Candidatus Wolbachia massiliensis]QOD38874.1 ankyrin repeat domain-containing protein [Candidatus Wolbachia massiliensis]
MAREESIDQLVESGFDINSKDANGITLLHKFTKEGDVVGVKSLLEHEADFNVVDNENRNPLHYAIMHGHKKIAKLLVNQLTINSKDKNGFTPLHLAALQDDAELIGFLVTKGAKINERDNQEGYTPLHIASLYGSKKSVQILIDSGANLECEDNNFRTPLFLTIYQCTTHYDSRAEIIEYLIKRGANIEARDAENNTTLFLAAYNNKMQIVKLIAKKQQAKANFKEFICVKNNHGFDSLDCAIEHNNRKMIAFLVSKGIEINDQDFNGNARLHKASYNGDTKAVKLLLKLKVDVNAVTKCNRTPLLLAVKKGHTKIVKMLLEVKANMNICEQQGYTPLHLAVQKGYFDIAQLLIEKGADLNVKCNDGYTAIDMFINISIGKKDIEESYKKFCRFLLLHLKELHRKYKVFCILSTLVLSSTILGLPFIFKPIIKYRERSKTYKKTKAMLENLLYI